MDTTWVLVADAARARIFAVDPRFRRLDELMTLIHSPSRVRETDVFSDSRGRQSAAGDFGRVGGMPPRQDLHALEALRFAREVSVTLERGLHDAAYHDLVVVAPPSFLGALRRSLSQAVSERVSHTIGKDYSRWTAHELRPLLKKRLAPDSAA